MNSTKYNEDFVKKLIRTKEGKHLDFKQKITSKEKIAKTLSAFSNTAGGLILIGVSDKKRIVGVDPEEEKYMVETANEEFCTPKATLSFYPIKWTQDSENLLENDEDIYLLLVEVASSTGSKVYCKGKLGELKAYQRIEDQTLAISNSY
ncbi:AlbA family DNA-binding domain-containing protein [Algoriphagus mannitolivorans]|uniref:AlbA family DNA-binding domain-containing protein n=1 Tax=Algoriphagus mannitolivorans TaxID=226504 RepID=UPI0004101721|nr:ATP-binding protein [Algoriphagus mannitolivorans]